MKASWDVFETDLMSRDIEWSYQIVFCRLDKYLSNDNTGFGGHISVDSFAMNGKRV